ncbi:hypothetical protein GLAREA_00815 [Glarea lozoyensis ATCC 20868]|uniref:Uncharacterized protein n=1 Tax=Glarea lozoyensis (strain ATCC 20868 / MF5171) TaxID=1116229 RepID=S3CVG9_GLAL2|nr:uncharacterized protein GLAREA_00815 [Glarea lozoyensis ATCC 20868]EPE29655.1 hypothetical protein GLAREA_00815 [Glarea lozoyensis ATCC 20868]
MLIQHTYTHACGHTGTGPILTYAMESPFSTPPPGSQQTVKGVLVPLLFLCPFCLPNTTHNTPPGSGILCIFAHPYWIPVKTIALHDLRPMDWAPSLEYNAMYGRWEVRHMAWIPMPEGYVTISEEEGDGGDEQVIGGREELGRFGYVQRGLIRTRTEVRSAWKERGGVEEMMSRGVGSGSRMAGLISQFHAAVKSGKMAGRYE